MMGKKLPLRVGVGAVVINKDKKIFVGKRKDHPNTDNWQMPQGGVNENEELLAALKRELLEAVSYTHLTLPTILRV